MINLVFTVRLFSKYAKTKNILFLLSGLITTGLFYDAAFFYLYAEKKTQS